MNFSSFGYFSVIVFYYPLSFVAAKGGVIMYKYHEKYKQQAFDCFCKRIIKNEMYDYYNEINRFRKHEKIFSELSENELKKLYKCDTYFIDEHIFHILDNDVIVNDSQIAKALMNLSEYKREIILLSYFLNMSDGEIGEQLNLVRSTVQYRRNRILKELRKFMEVNNGE